MAINPIKENGSSPFSNLDGSYRETYMGESQLTGSFVVYKQSILVP
jgi:hypothetical protein